MSNKLTDQARELRKNMTPAELLLWQKLRGKQLSGFKFRRQQPLGPFIAGFFCASARLVVELDGESHEEKEKDDAAKQRFLEQQGLTVLRVLNKEVYQNLDGVLATIVAHCQSRLNPPPPAPPTMGGEFGCDSSPAGEAQPNSPPLVGGAGGGGKE